MPDARQESLTLHLHALASVDPLDFVAPADLALLKAKDPHPYLQAYSFCHEGVAHPTVLGEKAKPITWLRQAVETIRRVVVKGVKFFLGHNEDSSTDGREALGEVVGSGERELDGKLHHIVVGYFPDKARVQALDICSQESDWDLIPGPLGYVADKLIKLTGIALSSSKTDRPAFPGAVRLGAVQAFAYKDNSGAPDGVPGPKAHRRLQMSDIMNATFQELDQALRARNVFPSQVFTLDQLKADRNFSPLIAKAEKYDADVEAVRNELKAANDKIKALETDTATARRSAELATAPSRLETLAKKAKEPLTEKQLAFAKSRLTEKVADLSDKGLEEFLSDSVAIFKAAVGADATTGETGQGAGASGAGQTTPAVEPGDFSKAANNPMLDADLTE